MVDSSTEARFASVRGYKSGKLVLGTYLVLPERQRLFRRKQTGGRGEGEIEGKEWHVEPPRRYFWKRTYVQMILAAALTSVRLACPLLPLFLQSRGKSRSKERKREREK